MHGSVADHTTLAPFVTELARDLAALPQRPRSFILPFLYSLAGKSLLMGILLLVFLAFPLSVASLFVRRRRSGDRQGTLIERCG